MVSFRLYFKTTGPLVRNFYRRMSTSDKKEKRVQPPWQPLDAAGQVQLKLYNSLTREKEVFVPQNGKQVLWYTCGPTVYDASHMGHARTYISLDILRRVMRDYFKYDILYCMNVTDIDDKIIKRARQNHLYDDYCQKERSFNALLHDTISSLKFFKLKTEGETDADKRDMYKRIELQVESCVSHLEGVLSGGEDGHDADEAKKRLLTDCRDILPDWLDSQHGSEVTDISIFTSLPRYWEEDFHSDMEALNVLPADVLTRVSDYVPEIVDFIQKIVDKNLAYEAGGSIYFDTAAFTRSGHYYAKLVPEAFGDTSALTEGEGVLSVTEERANEKRGPSDFALWKASKRGEPFWDSPWGKGRPGWHIECSVMASHILGKCIDIHTGGYDLKFPHHDNEIAQSEAYYETDDWVRYFVHTGHLTIQGCKMSKSLKNFITIKDALKKHTARQLRLAFLLHSYRDVLDYGDNTMEVATRFEKLLSEFFLNVKHVLRITPSKGVAAYQKWGDADIALNSRFMEKQQAIHANLCDSIDTRSVMENIRELIGHVNVYINDKRGMLPNRQIISNIAAYITRILQIFGAIDVADNIGFPQSTSEAANLEEAVMPYLSVLADFREKVRLEARSQKAASILDLCDDLRDTVLPDLGVRLEDHDGVPPSIKLVDRDTLLKERENKMKVQEAKRLEKERKRKLQEEEKMKQEAMKKLPPWEMFIHETDKYSAFDSRGLPTHDASGTELSKSQMKKLAKLYELQEKRYREATNAN